MIRYGFILLLICLCASLVLGVTYQFTHSRIEAQLVSEEKDALGEIFSEATGFEQKTLGEKDYYSAKKDDKALGYIIKVDAKGYGGIISMLVGFDFNGEIKGIEILSQSETPGLGAKINEIRYGENKPWFLKQFEGKDAKELELGRDVQAITAATISSRAVLEGVKKEVTDFLSRVKD
ncbi:MAG: RnfABCDGE type electron transport complex subunit G [Candidatus Omnitrophica bacterium]|nr:RnfABCDGE type electron transport complex subunit G [Candidatus Omnitrophota bacterium]